MTKKQRSTLFFLLFFLFLLSGPVVVFYSQGYRFDFNSRKITQTGALYFRITPRDSAIEITPESREKPVKKRTGFIFGTAFIENLLPKKYHIEVKKENYHSWKKTTEISEKMVTKFRDITLVPENPEFKVVMEDIKDFFWFPERNKFIIENNQNQFFLYGQDEPLFSYDQNASSQILEMSDKKLLIRTKKTGTVEYYISDIEEKDSILLNLPIEIDKISFHPKDDGKIVFLKENSLFIYQEGIELIFENVSTYNIRGDNTFFWISSDGVLFRNIENPRRINRKLFEIKEDKDYRIFFPNSSEIMIKEDNSFYLFNKENLEFRKEFQTDRDPITSPDFQKIAYFTDFEINILFLDNIAGQPQRKYGESVFLTRFSEKIDNINWYTSHYLVFSVSDRIKVMEIDNRDNINIVQLAEFKEPKISFSFPEKKLYLLSEGKLFVSKELIP